MTKKRRSLQDIFSPTFLHMPLPHDTLSLPRSGRARSRSTATDYSSEPPSPLSYDSALPDLSLPDLLTPPNDSPPADLLDEDPFACLSPAPSVQHSRRSSLALTGIDTSLAPEDASSLPPRSPLSLSALSPTSPTTQSASSSSTSIYSLPSTPPPTPLLPEQQARLARPKSSGGQVRPAYTRPAFAPRPSLPSLNTLTRSHVALPKVRRGRVGAQLPMEPWSEGEPGSPKSPSEARRRRHVRKPTELSTIRDSRMVLDGHSHFVGDDSPYDSQAELSAESSEVLTSQDYSGGSDLFDGRLECLSSATPSLYPSSVCSSSESAEHLPLDTSYPNLTYSSSSHPRHTRHLDSELIASLDYNYADAVSQLTGPPSPSTSGVIDPSAYFANKPGTSAETIRVLAATILNRPVSDEPELPLSPDSFNTEFSTSNSSSSGHSRASSCASTDYGEELPDESGVNSEAVSQRLTAFGIPWPLKGPGATPPLSMYGNHFPGDYYTDDDEDLNEKYTESSTRSWYTCRDDEFVDADDGLQRRDNSSRSPGSSQSGGANGSNGRSNGNRSGSSSGGYSGAFNGQGGSGGGRGGRGNDDRDRRPTGRPATLPTSDSDTSEDEEDEEDESSDDEDAPISRLTRTPGSPDDDVPLAQQIPTALNAQRTIRRQVREEISQRRREQTLRPDDKTLRAQSPNDRNEALARTVSAKAAKAAEPVSNRTLSGTTTCSPSKKDSLHASSQSVGRPRTKTLPGNTSIPISVGDLTKKLLGVQSNSALPTTVSRSRRPSVENKPPKTTTRPPSRDQSAVRGQGSGDHARSMSLFRRGSRVAKNVSDTDDNRGRSVRPARSFHRPSTASSEQASDLPISGSLGRHLSSLKKRPSLDPVAPMPVPPLSAPLTSAPKLPEEHRALERARSMRPASRRPSVEQDRPRMPSVDPESVSAGLRRPRRPSANGPEPPVPASHTIVSPFAPLGSGAYAAVQPKAQNVWQQRIFVGNMQRYVVVEIGASTTAGEVLNIVEGQGALEQGTGTGGWMLWEIAQDFGMERPIRSFELLSDVCGAWNTDKIVNLLFIKKTLLAPILSRSAIPRSSPICSGFVQHEYKRGKWQKRWLELREHSLWLSKRDGGKDSVFLCSLNNFDAYYVTRPHKAPKPYVFAVKSTDSLTFFENTSDYVHIFSCTEAEGKNWLEKILLARSYVLHQERNIIPSGAGLARASTTRNGQRAAHPLVNVGAPKAEGMTVPLNFEPGSLMAKRLPV